MSINFGTKKNSVPLNHMVTSHESRRNTLYSFLDQWERALTPEKPLGRTWYPNMRLAPELPYERMKFYN